MRGRGRNRRQLYNKDRIGTQIDGIGIQNTEKKLNDEKNTPLN